METTHYLPELDFWFKHYCQENAELSLFHVNLPETVGTLPVDSVGSVMELLFNNEFDHEDGYHHKFYYAAFQDFSNKIQDRIRGKHDLNTYFLSKPEGTHDILNLDDEITLGLLDELYNLRLGNPVDISGFDYGDLTLLQKLIYIYLEFKTTDDITRVRLILEFEPPDDLLEIMFMYYVLNEAHKHIRLSSDEVERVEDIMKPVRKYFSINPSLVASKVVTITGEVLPTNTSQLFVYHNGELLDNSAFDYLMDSTSLSISWAEKDTTIYDGDTLVVDYNIPLVEKTAVDLRGGLVNELPVGEI